MSLCNRLIGGIFDRLDTIASFWQTPREVEWAKAAADGGERCECGHRIHDSNVCPVGECLCLGWFPDRDLKRPVPDKSWVYTARERAKTSAPTPGAVDGPAVGSPDKPTAVVEGFPPHPVSREDRVGTHCEEYEEYGCGVTGCPAACYQRAPSAEVEPPASAPSAERSAPEFDWVTTAIPVIAGVLAEHKFLPIMGRCECPSLPRVADWQRWSEHVSPIIAIAIQSDLLSTIYEDTTFAINAFSGDRPRPLTDFPKHQNPRM